MSAEICACDNVGLVNTGRIDCEPLIAVSKKPIFVPTFKTDGTRNCIAGSDILNQAFLDGRINDTDASARWYPLPIIENVVDERAEDTVDTAPSGTFAFVQEGQRTVTFEIWNVNPAYARYIKANRCADMSVYMGDYNCNIFGSCTAGTDKLFPIRIQRNSMKVLYIPATDTTTSKLMISYQWATSERDENIGLIKSSDLGGMDLLGANGLLTVDGVYSNVTVDGFDASLVVAQGAKRNPYAVLGADIQVFNVTTSSALAVTVVDNEDGTYSVSYPTQNAGDVLRVTGTRIGFDFANLANITL